MKLRLRSILSTLGLFLFFSQATLSQIYPTFAGDMQRSGRSPYPGPIETRVGAQSPLPGSSSITTSGAVAFDGTVYYGSLSGLLAFDRRGEHRWTYPTVAPVTGNPTVAFDGTLYFIVGTDTLHAVYPDGSTKWQVATSPSTASPTLAADGSILVTSHNSTLHRFRDDGQSASKVCDYPATGPIYPPAAMAQDLAIVGVTAVTGSGTARIDAVDASCSLVWSAPVTGSSIHAAPTVDEGGNVYVVSSYAISGFLDKVPPSPSSPTLSVTLPGSPGRGSASLSQDGSQLYVTFGASLAALSTENLDHRWIRNATAGIESTPLVDADDRVYWAYTGGIEARDKDGEMIWSYDIRHEMPVAASPVLGAHGSLFLGASDDIAAHAVLHRIDNLLPWPSSDNSLDLAASGGLSYSDVHYDMMSDLPIVNYMSTHNLMKVAEVSPGEYEIRRFDRFRPNGDVLPVSPQRADYLRSFNPDFFTYDSDDGFDPRQQAEHHQRFTHLWNARHPHQPLGSYLSSTTCVDTPQDPANRTRTGNSFPATVLDCCAITNTTGACHLPWNSAPFYPEDVDGRYFLPFHDATTIASAGGHLRSILRQQHLTRHVFLDNGRYYIADNAQAKNCHRCVVRCAGDDACIANCKNDVLDPGELWTCVDSRDTVPFTLTPGHDQEVMADVLIDYFQMLFGALNAEGHRGILNVAVVPYPLGESIEEKRLGDFEAAVGPGNGFAFESAWHWNSRSHPRFAKQEIRVHQRFLDNDMIVVHFANYKDLGRQLWVAAMDVALRQPGHSLFVSRSAQGGPPAWSDWPTFYGSPNGILDFKTTCGDCLTEYRKKGAWSASRLFAGGRKITAVGLTAEVTVDTTAGTGSLDMPLPLVLTGDLSEYGMVHGPDFGTATVGGYTANADALIAELDASNTHKLDTHFVLGKDCREPLHCDQLVAVGIQVEVTVLGP